MKNVMIPEELFGKIIKYHLLDQEQEADDIRKGLEKKLDAMVSREAVSYTHLMNFRKFHWTALQRLSRWHLVKYRSILIATY